MDTTTEARPASGAGSGAAGSGAAGSAGSGTPAGGTTELLPLLARLTGDEKHEPSAHSTLEVLWTLYDRVLRVDPVRPDADDRDRLLVSKGHGPHAYYVVLAAKGFFPVAWLEGFAGPESRLGHHPDRVLVPGVEISSGSLGHGLALAVGTALGLRAQGLLGPRVYVLLGDGELDEGANAEAIAYAAFAELDSLTAIVVDNRSASWRQDLPRLFSGAGWNAVTVDGRDPDRLEVALRGNRAGRPHAVVAEVW